MRGNDTPRVRRSDAELNLAKILQAARQAFEEGNGGDVSMAEVSRRAGVGMATLYRNFSGRRELLEAVFIDEVDDVCAKAAAAMEPAPVEGLFDWLNIFFDFAFARSDVATELIRTGGVETTLFRNDKRRFEEAAAPLLAAARGVDASPGASGLVIGQILGGIVYIAQINEDIEYVRPIFETFIAGVRASI